MAISTEHVAGFVAGLGAAALGFYVYKKKQPEIDGWLRAQGINVPGSSGGDPASMSLEGLVAEKERLEDLIAEREMAAQTAENPAPSN